MSRTFPLPQNRPDRLLALLLVGAGFFGAAMAEESDSWLVLDRDAAVRHALSHNLELQVANWEIKKAEARLRWSGKLAPPEVEFSANTDRLGLNENESVLEIGISQRFPITDRLKQEKDLSRVEVAMARAEVAEARRQLIGEVERAFVETLAAREQVTQLTEIQDLLGGFVKTLDQQVAQGTVSSLDVNQAKLDRQQIAKTLQRQSMESRRHESALKTLLGISDATRMTLSGDLSLPKKDLAEPEVTVLRSRRPDFQLAVLKEDQARAELALADSKRWEDVAVRLFTEREASVDAPNGLEKNRFVGVGVSIPLPFKRERMIEEPTASLNQAEENSQAVSLRIENEIAAKHHARADLLRLARDTVGETLELAESNLKAIAKAYENGQIELFKYQRAQEQWLEAQLSALEARVSWHQADIDFREAAAAHREMDGEAKGTK
ncbi:MAG: TolC family protein [Verrucomicrobiae bacterium]|nr:TolC family protein [Verrucomicrobiae bacterium]